MTNYQIFRLMRSSTTTWTHKNEWVIIQVDHAYSTEDFDAVAAWNATDGLPVEGSEPYEINWYTLATYTKYEEFDGMNSFHLVKRVDLEKIGMD